MPSPGGGYLFRQPGRAHRRPAGGPQKIFRTDGSVYIYASNGHGAWEAAVTNVLSRGDKILVLESGRFALGWGEMAQVIGVEAEVLKSTPRRAVDPAALEKRLRRDLQEAGKAGTIKAVLVVQVDTASGVYNDIAAMGRVMRETGHPALADGRHHRPRSATRPVRDGRVDVDVAVSGRRRG